MRRSKNNSIFVGRSMSLKVTTLIFLKLDFTAAEFAVMFPYLKIGIIKPEHKR